MDEIAHIIPTCHRPRVATRLIRSIRHHYPGANVFVCDDSPTPNHYDGAENVPAPAEDIGLSAKRNLLVQASEQPYVMVWDDDYICTLNSRVPSLLAVLRSMDGVGILGGEWTLEHGNREIWYTGRIIPDGGTIRVRPPTKRPRPVSTPRGDLRTHRVDLLPNWFLARRDVLEACPWDETLKLNEHLEFFSRLTALRARSSDNPTDRGAEWLRRWRKRQSGKPIRESADGKIPIQAKGTFRNTRHLSHLPGNRISRGDWAEVDAEYGQELVETGKAISLRQDSDVRPFPLPPESAVSGVPFGVALTPDVTCRHHREEARGNGYDEKRFRRNKFMPLQKAKLGVSERDLVQWSKYRFGAPDFCAPNPDLLKLPDP